MFFHGIFLPWVRRAGLWLFWPALAVVVWGELTPHPPSVVNHFWDKSQHFIAYFALALLATLGWGLRRSLVLVFLGVLAIGGGLELLQTLAGRDGQWLDQFANALGAMTGMAVAAVYLAIPRRLVDGAPRD